MRWFSMGVLVFLLSSLQAQAPNLAPPTEQPQGSAQIQNEIQPIGSESAYQLDAGDRIRITVFNQDDLSGDYSLDDKGRFSMPLIGAVKAQGLTPAELENLLTKMFKPDYLVNPRIYVQVISYRPYYLIGEALGTGAFPYIAGMTYMKAIAIAGGFSYRAKQDYVYVIRADDAEQQEVKVDINEKVQPGDIIRVAERLF